MKLEITQLHINNAIRATEGYAVVTRSCPIWQAMTEKVGKSVSVGVTVVMLDHIPTYDLDEAGMLITRTPKSGWRYLKPQTITLTERKGE